MEQEDKIKVVQFVNGREVIRLIPNNLMDYYTGGAHNFLQNIGAVVCEHDWNKYNVKRV